MRPHFHPSLVNPPFGDPGLYVDCLFERRALLFDLGEIAHVPPRKLLRISDVFVTHTHMDHFIGFDWLVRICLGRDTKMRLFGPPRFVEQVEHRLSAYTWNLVENYDTDFSLEVTEIHPEGAARRARFRCKNVFRREADEEVRIEDGLLLDEDLFRVRCAPLDHKTVSLGYCLEEKSHVNVWKNRLEEMGLPVGPWLKDLKHAVMAGDPDDRPVRVSWKDGQGTHERFLPLGELKEKALEIVPGQKISYVTDVVFHPENARRIARLAHGADLFFIESTFLDEDVAKAQKTFHLTAGQAGLLARMAEAKAVQPFHFSPRYGDREGMLRQQVADGFGRHDIENSPSAIEPEAAGNVRS